MHFSDSAILRANSSIVFCISPTLSWPTVKRAISSRFSMARFFLSCARCQAILLLLSAIAMFLIRLAKISQRFHRANLRGESVPLHAIWPHDDADWAPKDEQREKRDGREQIILVAPHG